MYFSSVLPHIVQKILDKGLYIHKAIRLLESTIMPVITFTSLVVITDNSYSILDESQPILVAMRPVWLGFRKLPYHHFDNAFSILLFLIEDTLGFHRAHYARYNVVQQAIYRSCRTVHPLENNIREG